MDEQKKPAGLTPDTIDKLLNKQTKKEKSHTPNVVAVDDIYEKNAAKLLELMDEKVDSVKMGRYTMVVSERKGNDLMYVRPKEGFVPCGWLSRSWLNEKLPQRRR